MWHDHPFRQRNKATKRAMGIEVEVGEGVELDSCINNVVNIMDAK